MEVIRLKEKLLEEDKIELILEDLDCHHVVLHGHDYYTCGNPDGNNKSAITVYLNDYLGVVNYTRDITNGQTRGADILDLVMWAKDCNFIDAVKYICDTCEWDYYEKDEPLPESLRILKMLKEMASDGCSAEEDETQLEPISEDVLKYYMPVGNNLFEMDNISLSTQQLFEVGYDPYSNYITIPIRDELGTLIGVKGRIFKEHLDDGDMKYIYLEPCAKSRILYGLYKNLNNIIQQGKVYVVESEKAVMQLYELGYYAVSTGGSKISKSQINMITRLGVDIVFAYDRDISKDELHKISCEFIDGVPVYAMIDNDNILNEKESPTDRPEAWFAMLKNIQRIK